jgi:hypothetical protein
VPLAITCGHDQVLRVSLLSVQYFELSYWGSN